MVSGDHFERGILMPVNTSMAQEDRPLVPEPTPIIDSTPYDFADVWCDIGGSD